jgi:energy-converting hydrogenase Eha subunit F
LRKYLNATPKEEIKKNWESLSEFDKVGIPVKEFLNKTSYYFKYERHEEVKLNNQENPKFASDFLF